MIIRRDQIRAFEAYMKASFEDRMAAHMAARYPRQYAEYNAGGDGDAGARALIRRAVEKSLDLGARRESSIQQMLEIMLETTAEFDQAEATAWTRDILGDLNLAGGTRILLVHQRVHAQKARASQQQERKD